MSSLAKNDKELMLIALAIVPQLNGLKMAEIEDVLHKVKCEAQWLQSFNLPEDDYHERVAEWQNAER